MDIFCQYCAEPFDILHITDEFTPAENKAFYAGAGCTACNWGQDQTRKSKSMTAAAMTALSDVMGSDVDGMAAMMEDFEYLGLLD